MANEDLLLMNSIIGAISDRMPTAKDRTQEDIQRDTIKMQMANLSLAGNAQTALNEYRDLQLYGKENPEAGDTTLAQQAETRASAADVEAARRFNIENYGTPEVEVGQKTFVDKQFHEITEAEARRYHSMGSFEAGMQIPIATWLKIVKDDFNSVPLGLENSMYLYESGSHKTDKVGMEAYANIEKIRLENTPINPDIFMGQMDEGIRRKIFYEPQTEEQKKTGEYTSKKLRPAETEALISLLKGDSNVDDAMELVTRKAALDAYNMPPMSIFVPDAYETSSWAHAYNESQMLDMIEGRDPSNPFPLSIYRMEGALTSFRILYNANDARGLAAVENLQGIGDELMKPQFYNKGSVALGFSDQRRAFENIQQIQANYFVITGKQWKPSPGIEVPAAVLAKFPEYGEAFQKDDSKGSKANALGFKGAFVKEIVDFKGEKVQSNDISNIYLYQTEEEIRKIWDGLPEINADSTKSQSYWKTGGATDEQGYMNYRAWYANDFKNQVEMGKIDPANFPTLKIGEPKKKTVPVAPRGLSVAASAEIKAQFPLTIRNNLGRAKRRAPKFGVSIKDILMDENGWSEEAAEHIIKNY